MNDIHILVTMPQHAVFRTFFDADAMAALEHIGTVHWNTLGRQYTQDELGAAVRGMDICVTGWGTPVFDEAVLAQADRLRLIAHTGGSVKPYVTDAVYGRGIRVVSGNEVFAESVAESVVAYALASLRQIPYHSVNLAGGIWPESFANRGLLDRSVGIVGYGMIARYVVGMLAPFHCPIKVFSRHIGQDELDRCHMEKAELEELFATCDIISIHSGMTPENHHLVTRELLQSMKPAAAPALMKERVGLPSGPARCLSIRRGAQSSTSRRCARCWPHGRTFPPRWTCTRPSRCPRAIRWKSCQMCC